MPHSESNAESQRQAQEGAALIRAAISAQHDLLLRSIALLVAKTERRLRWPEALEIAAEVLREATQEALKHAQKFDRTRSAAAWVRGIAARLLLGRRRAEARGKRCLSATVLGDEAWTSLLSQQLAAPADADLPGRLDLEQALAGLSPAERRAIECRYYQGLDGDELARSLGAATPGAARVRVCRALQSLRTHFVPAQEEVFP